MVGVVKRRNLAVICSAGLFEILAGRGGAQAGAAGSERYSSCLCSVELQEEATGRPWGGKAAEVQGAEIGRAAG